MGYTPVSGEALPRVGKRSPMWLHALLFVLTFASTMLAGTAWIGQNWLEVTNITHGLTYAVLLMLFLSAHEFGHYIAARRHGVDVSLPYFIPMPLLWLLPFGTMGAVIRTRQAIPSRTVLFDIGVAGPLAGFVVCLAILAVGFATLPPIDYLYQIHPEYRMNGMLTTGMYFGDTIVFSVMRSVFAQGASFIPPMNEIYHYPFLCVGWFGLFVTALNMLPFGQLDGGHVLYALVGERQFRVARILWWCLFVAGMLSLLGVVQELLSEPSPEGFVIWLQHSILPALDAMKRTIPWIFTLGDGWLIWAILIRFVIRIPHPPVADDVPLSRTRKIVGWFAIVVLIVSFTPRMIYFVQ